MTVYHWILLSGVGIFLVSGFSMFFKVILRKGNPDPAPSRGHIGSAIIYSFTKAMSPLKKESAFLHLPTYTAGMIYHTGTFLSFFFLVVFFFNIRLNAWIDHAFILIIFIAVVCGTGILIKRIVQLKLRSFSNPDDYFSNLLVTGFQIMTAMTVITNKHQLLFIYAAILFLYIPIGKLRHAIYFFTTRIQLGKFYGKRGVWPLSKVTNHGNL
jgi:hypothetical protein